MSSMFCPYKTQRRGDPRGVSPDEPDGVNLPQLLPGDRNQPRSRDPVLRFAFGHKQNRSTFSRLVYFR
ncbi:hypothetical protein P7K49_040850 [Saguinus oedipus]|uniref:Uncharacterized protein n=1 Tax=Saguinus oedipus TaxID=9490 RepID=A0ABQ9TB49_SAGOE|nr:hypothetical protein P7K49_040850 [Saguinus oedipus]